VDEETEKLLHVGWHAVVTPDGQSVLVGDLDENWKVVDVATGKAKSVTLPGVTWLGVVACPTKDMALSWCWPTTGTPMKFTSNNSPVVGPKRMQALKLIDLATGEFQTVVPHVDQRSEISFGASP
jgi:hypothetical protein